MNVLGEIEFSIDAIYTYNDINRLLEVCAKRGGGEKEGE